MSRVKVNRQYKTHRYSVADVYAAVHECLPLVTIMGSMASLVKMCAIKQSRNSAAPRQTKEFEHPPGTLNEENVKRSTRMLSTADIIQSLVCYGYAIYNLTTLELESPHLFEICRKHSNLESLDNNSEFVECKGEQVLIRRLGDIAQRAPNHRDQYYVYMTQQPVYDRITGLLVSLNTSVAKSLPVCYEYDRLHTKMHLRESSNSTHTLLTKLVAKGTNNDIFSNIVSGDDNVDFRQIQVGGAIQNANGEIDMPGDGTSKRYTNLSARALARSANNFNAMNATINLKRNNIMQHPIHGESTQVAPPLRSTDNTINQLNSLHNRISIQIGIDANSTGGSVSERVGASAIVAIEQYRLTARTLNEYLHEANIMIDNLCYKNEFDPKRTTTEMNIICEIYNEKTAMEIISAHNRLDTTEIQPELFHEYCLRARGIETGGVEHSQSKRTNKSISSKEDDSYANEDEDIARKKRKLQNDAELTQRKLDRTDEQAHE